MDRAEKQKVILLCLLILGVSWFAYSGIGGFAGVRGLRDEAAKLEQERNTLQNEVRNAQQMVANLGRIKKEREALEAQLTELSRRLPTEAESASVLRSVETLAGKSGLMVGQVKRRANRKQELYVEIPMEVGVGGGYHDLLKFYATERARGEEPETDRADAVRRLLYWYLVTADAGADILSPHRYRVPLGNAPDVTASPLTSAEDALGWYDSERVNVIAAIRQAAAIGLHDVAWRLSGTLQPVFNRRDNWADCSIANRIGADSARRAGHRQGEAWVLQNLGQALARMRDKEALPVLEQALQIRREIDDRTGEAQTAISLGDAYHKLQGPEAARQHSARSLQVLRKVGNAALLGIGLNNHGEFCLELGRLDEAAECFREALGLAGTIGGYAQGFALHNLGRVHLESGRPDEAITSLTEAHRIHRASGDLIGQAVTLKHLGQARHAVGDDDEARQAWTAALAIYQSLEADPEVADISSALETLAG